MHNHASNVWASRLGACVGVAAFLAPFLAARSAHAHIEMLDPPPRYLLQDGSDNGIKSCPCGLGSSNRVCNLAQDASDPDRSTRVSRFEAGSTITLRFEEFINHAGRFRVAFDPDGADMADFNDNILTDVQDPANANNMVWEIPVRLPDVTCTNCTLQLVQAMEVDIDTPIADPAPISSYYSCVDIELVAPGTLGNEPPPDPNAGEPGTDPDGDTPGTDPGMDPMGGGTDDGDGSSSGSQNAGDMSGTPLIPAGSGAPMDSPGSSGATPDGMVAMNGMPGAPASSAPPGVSMPQPLPALGDPNAGSSSSGGCSIASAGPARGVRAGSLGLGVLALGALLGLGRRGARRG